MLNLEAAEKRGRGRKGNDLRGSQCRRDWLSARRPDKEGIGRDLVRLVEGGEGDLKEGDKGALEGIDKLSLSLCNRWNTVDAHWTTRKKTACAYEDGMGKENKADAPGEKENRRRCWLLQDQGTGSEEERSLGVAKWDPQTTGVGGEKQLRNADHRATTTRKRESRR